MNVYEFASHPNQKKVRIMKRELKGGSFSTVETEPLLRAARNLSWSALRLYIYLLLNANGFEFWLSCAHVCEKTGLSNSSFHRSVNELISKSYLEYDENEKIYIFYEYT